MQSGYNPQQMNAQMQGGIQQLLMGLFGNSGSPYGAAQGPYQGYLNKGVGAQNPFYNAGTQAIGNYQGMLNNMSNPSQFYNNLMGQYQESPYAKFLNDQAQRANTNSASASGLIGSTPYQQAGEQYSQQISGQDMQNWLQNVLGINNQALGGYQNLMQGGQGAANQLSNMYGNAGNYMGGLAYGQQAGQQQDFGNLIGGLTQLFA